MPSSTHHRSLQETLELAQALIRIPSANPPGAENAVAAFAAEWLLRRGIPSQMVPLEEGRSSLVARILGEGSRSIVLCAHLDTVTAETSLWQHSPLEPRIEAGRLWGLGSTDMKSAVAVLMHSFAHLAGLRRRLEKDVVLVLTADEEWEYHGAASVASSGLLDDAELAIIAEPTGNDVCTGQKGELWVEAVFTGKEAHGSVPESGANAVLAAARFSLRLQDTVSRWPELPSRGRTSLNIGRFRGGRQVNIVPAEARIELDLRVISDEHYEMAMAAVSEIGAQEAAAVGGAFTFREMTYHPAIASGSDHAWAQMLIAASQTVTGRQQPRGLTPYSTDAVSLVPVLDIPVLVCGPGSILQAHQPNEFIEIDQIAQALAVYASLFEGENNSGRRGNP